METFTVDLHTHTRFFHGFPAVGRRFDPLGARMLGLAAAARGLDAFVTTNHDYYRDLSPGTTDVAVIPGIEVTTTDGHVLVVGPDPPVRTSLETLTPVETVEMAHERGCAAIITHPFRNSTVRKVEADFDAIEVNGKGSESDEWIHELAERRDLPLVGGSDAHYPIEVARAFTKVRSEDLTPRSLVDAIRDGRVEPRIDASPSQEILRAAYRLVHSKKGWLDRPSREPPGLGTPPGEDG